MSTIEHRGRTYRPASEAQPKEGDRVAVLHDDCERTWLTEGECYRNGSPLRVTPYEVIRDRNGSWTENPIHIIERAPEPLPEGGIVILEKGKDRVFRWHRDGVVHANRRYLNATRGEAVIDLRERGWTVRPATVEDLRGESS